MGAREGLLLGAAAYLCWGLLSPGNAILLEDFDPLWLQAVRGVLAAAVFGLFMRRDDWRTAASYLRKPEFLLLALANVAGFTFFILAQTRIPATFTTLGFYTAPIWTAVLAWWMLKEPVGNVFGATVLALLAGGWLALGRPGLTGVDLDGVGVLLAVGSGAAWAWYSVLLRRAGDAPFRPLLWFTFFCGAVWFVVGALLFEPLPDWAAVSARGWRWTIIQVAVPTLAALGLFQAAMRRAPAARVNVLVGIELAGTAVWSWLLLGEGLDAVQAVGVGVVLVAVSLYLWSRARGDAALATPDRP